VVLMLATGERLRLEVIASSADPVLPAGRCGTGAEPLLAGGPGTLATAESVPQGEPLSRR
jgi:hypothetical protein